MNTDCLKQSSPYLRNASREILWIWGKIFVWCWTSGGRCCTMWWSSLELTHLNHDMTSTLWYPRFHRGQNLPLITLLQSHLYLYYVSLDRHGHVVWPLSIKLIQPHTHTHTHTHIQWLNTHCNNVFHFLFVQTAISISVVNLKRPSQFVLEFPTKHQMQRCDVFHEVYVTILRRQQSNSWCNTKVTNTEAQHHSILLSMLHYPVGIKGSENVFHVGHFFLCGAAVDSKDPLEFVQVQISTWTFTRKLTVKFLDVLKSHFRFSLTLCLTHDLKH